MTNTEFASVADRVALNRATEAQASTGFLSRLSVGQKLLLSSALLGLPLLGVSGALGSLYYKNYREAEQHSLALVPFSSLEKLQGNLQAIRGYDIAQMPPELISDTAAQAKALVSAAKATGLPGVVDAAKNLQDKTITFTRQLQIKALTNREVLIVSDDLLSTGVQSLLSSLASKGNLLGATNPQARQLAQMSSTTLPTLLPQISSYLDDISRQMDQARRNPGSKLSATQTNQLLSDFAEADRLTQTLRTNTENLIHDYPALKASLGPAFEKALSDTTTAFNTAQSGSTDLAKVTLGQKDMAQVRATLLASQHAAFSQTNAAMREAFQAQKQTAGRNLAVLVTALLGLLALLSLLLSRVIRNITRPLQELTRASERLAGGDLSVQVPVKSRDELGLLSSSFNSAAFQLRTNAAHVEQERLEAQRLQRNVGDFLDVTMDIAEGDLTKRGKVTEDVLGNVVDSINLMVEELAGTLKDVQKASLLVTGGSKTVLNSTDQIAQGATTTADQTRQVAKQANDLNARIQAMASIARASADKARQALEASQEGQSAVNSTLEGMQEIRSASQQTAERVQSLAARSEEIQVIVDSISHIASQTNLLSLHASIEAAGAGEAGGRFGVVAEEVRQLADESSAAASRIASLLSGIQSEIREVAQSIQDNAQQVEQGYQVAGQAGERLRQIGALSEESAELAVTISDAASEQVSGVQQMGQSVQQIAEIAQRSQDSVQQGRTAAQQLQQLAQQLDQSLRRFRLTSEDPSRGV